MQAAYLRSEWQHNRVLLPSIEMRHASDEASAGLADDPRHAWHLQPCLRPRKPTDVAAGRSVPRAAGADTAAETGATPVPHARGAGASPRDRLPTDLASEVNAARIDPELGGHKRMGMAPGVKLSPRQRDAGASPHEGGPGSLRQGAAQQSEVAASPRKALSPRRPAAAPPVQLSPRPRLTPETRWREVRRSGSPVPPLFQTEIY